MLSSSSIKRSLSTLGRQSLINRQNLSIIESTVKYGIGAVISPMYLLGLGWFSVPQNYKGVIQHFGKYKDTFDSGLHFQIPVSVKYTNIFTGMQSYKLPRSKIVDSNGNPLIVSAIFNYHIQYPEEYVFNIFNENYLFNQSEAVLKKVVAKYPYESTNGEPSLKDETDEVNALMKKELQSLVNIAGVVVDEFYLTDLNYASEISQQMLIRQQAKAYIDAKREISTAGVEIVGDTLKQLSKLGFEVSAPTKEKLISNLLTVVTSGTSVTPTLSVEGERN